VSEGKLKARIVAPNTTVRGARMVLIKPVTSAESPTIMVFLNTEK
jgi:hypothetical protein